MALLKPKDSRERNSLISELRDAVFQIDHKRLRLKSDMTAAERKRLTQYRGALVKADRLFPKLPGLAQLVIADDGKINKTVPTFDHKKQIASIDRLLKSKPRPAHRDEADKFEAKKAARLILSRVGRRCSVDDLAAALHGTAGTFRNIK